MRVATKCPRCGQPNARALRHCTECGEWLHGSSPVVGVCPQCRTPLHASELACSNCGRYVDGQAKRDHAPRLPEERRLSARARKATRRPAAVTARALSLTTLLCAAGGLVAAASAGRVVMAVGDYRRSVTPDEAVLAVYGVVLWSIAVAVGAAVVVAALLRRERRE